jgi:hypothetical protein
MTNLRPYEPGRDPLTGYVTRDGRKVRILATDRRTSGDFCLVGLVDGVPAEEIQFWRADGTTGTWSNHYLDLMCAPERRTAWVNFYPEIGIVHLSREKADARATKERIACVEVTFTEGEGL